MVVLPTPPLFITFALSEIFPLLYAMFLLVEYVDLPGPL